MVEAVKKTEGAPTGGAPEKPPAPQVAAPKESRFPTPEEIKKSAERALLIILPDKRKKLAEVSPDDIDGVKKRVQEIIENFKKELLDKKPPTIDDLNFLVAAVPLIRHLTDSGQVEEKAGTHYLNEILKAMAIIGQKLVEKGKIAPEELTKKGVNAVKEAGPAPLSQMPSRPPREEESWLTRDPRKWPGNIPNIPEAREILEEIDMKIKSGETLTQGQYENYSWRLEKIGEQTGRRDELTPFLSNFYEHAMAGIARRPTYEFSAQNAFDIHNDPQKRDRIYYNALQDVIGNPYNSSRDSFGLHQRETMNRFYSIVRQIPKIGPELANYYINKTGTVLACHDMEYWCANPAGDIEGFQKSCQFYYNSYAATAMTDPWVDYLTRIYEEILWEIFYSCDRRIPPSLVEYNPALPEGTMLEHLVMERFRQLVKSNQIFDAKKEKDGRLKFTSRDVVELDLERPVEEKDLDFTEGQGLRLYAAMRQAKGFGMVSARFLEIYALNRVPGVKDWNLDHAEFEKAFCSIPYEGIARYINGWHLILKYKQGDASFVPYWNLLLTGNEKAVAWDSSTPFKAFEAASKGELDKMFGPRAQRFMDNLNFSKISGRFGPWTTWAVMDSIIGWSDKEKEKLGGAIRFYLTKGWAEEKAREYLIGATYQEKYRRDLEENNQLPLRPDGTIDEVKFQKLWKAWAGNPNPTIGKYTREINEKWAKLKKQNEGLIENTNKSYNAMVWFQTVMRAPKIIARNFEVEYTPPGHKEPKKRLLRNVILERILGSDYVPEEELYTGAMPTPEQRGKIEKIAELEGAISAVQQRAIQLNRDLTEADFDVVIKEPELNQRAKRYWQMCQEAIFGKIKVEDRYKAIGLRPTEKNLEIDWKTMKDKRFDVAKLLKDNGSLLTEKHLDSEKIYGDLFRYLFGTDDVSWRELNLLNLGSRIWARRGGDMASDAQGKMELATYLGMIGPKLDAENKYKQLKKVYDAFAGNDVNPAYEVIWQNLLATGLFYKADWFASPKASILGPIIGKFRQSSVAQRTYGSTTEADALSSNDLKKWCDGALQMRLVRPATINPFDEGKPWKPNVEELKKRLGATDWHAIWEILSLGLVVAMILVVWAAFQQSMEEEKKRKVD